MCLGDDPTCAAFAEHRLRYRRDMEPERRAFLKSGSKTLTETWSFPWRAPDAS